MTSNTDIFKKNKSAIVLFLLDLPNHTISIRGTGFIIDDGGKVFTNAHVYNEISEADRQYLKTFVWEDDKNGIAEYKLHSVSLMKKNDEDDVALFQLGNSSDSKNTYCAIQAIDSVDVSEGEELVFLGFPLATELMAMGLGITLTINKCVVASVKRKAIDGSIHFYFVDTHINAGSSGSPIFSSQTGKVIGIVSGTINQTIVLPKEVSPNPIKIPANIGVCRPIKNALNLF